MINNSGSITLFESAIKSEYTTKSTIKHEVNKNKIDQETLFEESEFDIPSDQSKHLSFDLTNLVTRNAPEHVFNDEDTREKLAREIGLRDIPKLDATAFDRLAGMLGKRIKLDKIDAVETVRAIRVHNVQKFYIDTNVLISYISGPQKEPTQYPKAQKIFSEIKQGIYVGVISTLVLIELGVIRTILGTDRPQLETIEQNKLGVCM